MQVNLTTMNTNSRDSFLTYNKNQEDELNLTKSQIDEAKEENEKLKSMLSKIMKDYRSLQMHFQGISTNSKDATSLGEEEAELVSLRLGTTSRDFKKQACGNECKVQRNSNFDGLELGLDCRFSHSPQNSFEEKELTITEPCRQNPSSKMARSEDDDEDVLEQNPVKKARVTIRAVCDTPTMIDGCQWRKYGQKIGKGNPCPRAYYRCTISPSCSVRKQVQRCYEDMSILITTYEGTHNHPLPVSATAMASTTSAAASMLTCTSSSSSTSLQLQHQPANNGFKLTTSKNILATHNAPSFHLPKTSFSTSQSHPTITLDYTTVPTSSSSSQRYSNSSTPFNFSRQPSVTPSSSSSNSYTAIMWNKFRSQIGAASYLGRPCFPQPFITSNNTQDSSIGPAFAAAISSMVCNREKGNSALMFPPRDSLSFSVAHKGDQTCNTMN